MSNKSKAVTFLLNKIDTFPRKNKPSNFISVYFTARTKGVEKRSAFLCEDAIFIQNGEDEWCRTIVRDTRYPYSREDLVSNVFPFFSISLSHKSMNKFRTFLSSHYSSSRKWTNRVRSKEFETTPL